MPTSPDARAAQPTRRGTLLASIVLAIGLVLLVFMVVTEDEPGALPLAVVVLGLGGLLVPRLRR